MWRPFTVDPSRSHPPSLSARLAAKTKVAIAIGVIASPLTALAAPLVVEESARISNPDLTYEFHDVAIDGDYLIATASRLLIPSDDPDCCHDTFESTAYLFALASDGTWNLVSRFATVQGNQPMAVGMGGGIAALVAGSGPVSVYERSGTQWLPAATDANGFITTDIEVDAGTILLSASPDDHQAFVLRKNPAGTWTHVSTLVGPQHLWGDSGSSHPAGDVDISGDTIVIGGDAIYETDSRDEVHVFSGAAGSYAKTAVLNTISDHVAVHGTTLLSGASSRAGWADPHEVTVFERQGAGTWVQAPSLIRVDAAANGGSEVLELTAQYALASYPADPQRGIEAGSVGVFKRDEQGAFQYVATLLPSDILTGGSLESAVETSGSRVAVAGPDAIYVFDLPTEFEQPAAVHDDFESGSAAQWAPVPGSSFSVVTSGSNRVFRQTSLAGNAAATLATDRENQAMTADIKPTAFDGADRWFGLALRYTNEQNYYYVTVRGSNLVQIKKMVGGSFQTLASAPLSVTLNRTYRIGFEAVGTLLRTYVDGKLVVQAHDEALSHGKAGIRMYKTRADYDNVVVTSGPRLRLSSSDHFDWMFPSESGEQGQWYPGFEGSTPVLQQFDSSGPARLVDGISTDTQVIETRARAVDFSATGQSWFGVLARYVDDGNYYYVTVRKDNTISLRKLVNGTIHVLGSAQMTVTEGTWYRLRLETIGNKLRVFVNGTLRLQATDSSFSEGRFGVLMYKTAGEYVDLTVSQP